MPGKLRSEGFGFPYEHSSARPRLGRPKASSNGGRDVFAPGSTADCVHGAERLHEPGRIDLVPFPLGPNISPNNFRNGFFGRPGPKQRLDVFFIQGKEPPREELHRAQVMERLNAVDQKLERLLEGHARATP